MDMLVWKSIPAPELVAFEAKRCFSLGLPLVPPWREEVGDRFATKIGRLGRDAFGRRVQRMGWSATPYGTGIISADAAERVSQPALGTASNYRKCAAGHIRLKEREHDCRANKCFIRGTPRFTVFSRCNRSSIPRTYPRLARRPRGRVLPLVAKTKWHRVVVAPARTPRATGSSYCAARPAECGDSRAPVARTKPVHGRYGFEHGEHVGTTHARSLWQCFARASRGMIVEEAI
jgi:hypothetical protein